MSDIVGDAGLGLMDSKILEKVLHLDGAIAHENIPPAWMSTAKLVANKAVT